VCSPATGRAIGWAPALRSGNAGNTTRALPGSTTFTTSASAFSQPTRRAPTGTASSLPPRSDDGPRIPPVSLRLDGVRRGPAGIVAAGCIRVYGCGRSHFPGNDPVAAGGARRPALHDADDPPGVRWA